MTAAPARDGIYALASLDGAPLDRRDLAVLGLCPDDAAAGLALAIRDGAGAIDLRGGHAAFLGHLDEPAALADALGLDRSASAATLALAALDRFGADAPAHMPGEWGLLRWDAAARTLVLLASDTLRDPVLFATDGRRVAVAPHIAILRHLDWIDATPWNAGLLPYLGHSGLRATIAGETILRSVRRVRAGTRVAIARTGTTTGARCPLPDPDPWRGSFADAIEALEDMLRLIVGQRLARHRSAAVMLSGGLDSSLIAAFAAAERRPGRPLVALTSAAPPGSGLADETGFSRTVADAVGIPVLPVVPDAGASVYRPSPRMLAALQHPVASPRHHVYDALFATAVERGADTIFDGTYGEWTVSGYLALADRRERLRAAVRRAAGLFGRPMQDAFWVRLSPAARMFARTGLPPVPAARLPADPNRRGSDRIRGYSPGIAQTLMQATTTPWPGLRLSIPFRDRRLLTLFAGMPDRFMVEAGRTRAPARAMLDGRVPDRVRLRSDGRPFSPDFGMRIRDQAMDARAAIAAYRRAGVDEWIDLAWLDAALVRMAAGRDTLPHDVFAVQSTATAAAFLCHWLTGTA